MKALTCNRSQPSRRPSRLLQALSGKAALPWPLPAVLCWLLAWALFLALHRGGLETGTAWLLAMLPGSAVAFAVRGAWRRLLVVAGFPLSSLALGANLPTWTWLVAAAPLALAYPLRAWSDAPFFPTPRHALQALASSVPLAAGAQVLDAGCGLGHGLHALRAAWPQARLHGVEWSGWLAWWCARRCPTAAVVRGDMWALSWAPYDLVYLFQRPESMSRAWAKACSEMPAGTWLVSLEFAIGGVQPLEQLDAGRGRPLWVYRVPPTSASGSKKPRRGR